MATHGRVRRHEIPRGEEMKYSRVFLSIVILCFILLIVVNQGFSYNVQVNIDPDPPTGKVYYPDDGYDVEGTNGISNGVYLKYKLNIKSEDGTSCRCDNLKLTTRDNAILTTPGLTSGERLG
jgi:hypothetical protein